MRIAVDEVVDLVRRQAGVGKRHHAAPAGTPAGHALAGGAPLAHPVAKGRVAVLDVLAEVGVGLPAVEVATQGDEAAPAKCSVPFGAATTSSESPRRSWTGSGSVVTSSKPAPMQEQAAEGVRGEVDRVLVLEQARSRGAP